MNFPFHPGPWQTFLKRKDIIGLSPQEARKQYLIEQNGFNTAIANASAVASANAAAASGTSGGENYRETIARQKGYDIRPLKTKTKTLSRQKSKFTRTSNIRQLNPKQQREQIHSTFFYGNPNQLTFGNYPVWELLVTQGSPADHPFGYCVFNETLSSWYLTNTVGLPPDSSSDNTYFNDDGDDIGQGVYAMGPGHGIGFGKFIRPSGEHITIEPNLSSGFPKLICDPQDIENNGGVFFEYVQSPITHNGAPVYLSAADGGMSMLVFASSSKDVDGAFEAGTMHITGSGWNTYTISEDIYTFLSKMGTDNQPASHDFATPISTDINVPTGSAFHTNEHTPTIILLGSSTSLDNNFLNNKLNIASSVAKSNLGSFMTPTVTQIIGQYVTGSSLINGKPHWVGITGGANGTLSSSISWDNSNWVINSSSGQTMLVLNDNPHDPTGYQVSIYEPGIPEAGAFHAFKIEMLGD